MENTNELDYLQIEAQKIDAALNDQAATDHQEAPSLNAPYKPMIVKALKVGAGFGDAIIPFTSRCFNDIAIDDIAENLINVADVEQVELKKIFGEPNSRIGAWISLAIAVGSPSFMFYLALREYNEAKKKTQPEKEVKGDIVSSPDNDDLRQQGFTG